MEITDEPINIIHLYGDEPAPENPDEKKIPEPVPPSGEEQTTEAKENNPDEKSRKRNSLSRPLVSIISGSIFTREEVVRHLPYFLFLAFIALLYIANGYYAEDTVRQLNKAGNELKELRSEYISTKSDLMYISKQSEVANMAEKKSLGLKESLVPPQKIVVKN